MIAEVNSFATGWVTYFRYAACKSALGDIDEWLRRRLRCVWPKQCKRPKPIADFLMKCGRAGTEGVAAGGLRVKDGGVGQVVHLQGLP